VQNVLVFYVDAFELQLRQKLLDLLQDAPEGKAATQLWSLRRTGDPRPAPTFVNSPKAASPRSR